MGVINTFENQLFIVIVANLSNARLLVAKHQPIATVLPPPLDDVHNNCDGFFTSISKNLSYVTGNLFQHQLHVSRLQ